MAIDFPNSPADNEQYTVGDRTWTWNGTYWEMSTSTSTFTAGDSEPVDADPGDIWFDSTIGKTFVNYNGTWVEIGNAATVVDVIADADADTKVQVEVTADSDKIEFTTAGTKRLEIDSFGHVIPAANETYDLGSASNRFRDLYLSGSSIDLGGVSITSDGSNISLPNVDDIAASSVTVAGENVTPYTGRRNLLYNGAMQIAQRGTSVSSQYVSGYYTVDRWQWFSNATGARWDMSQDSDAPDGFRNSWKITCSQSLATPAAGDYVQVSQRLEGFDVQHLAKGTSSSKELTLSFWVKSNVTGTYIARLFDDQNLRATHRAYTVSSSDTWEYKTLTFDADTVSAVDNDNTEGLRLTFWLASGTNYNSGTLATSWAAYSGANSAVGNVNLASAVNNYWQITGVQLEVGDKATPFEHRSFGEELALCQRYYTRFSRDAGFQPVGGTGICRSSTDCSRVTVDLPTTMRTNGNSANIDYNNMVIWDGVNVRSITSFSLVQVFQNKVSLDCTTSGLTVGYPGVLLTNTSSGAYFAVQTEL